MSDRTESYGTGWTHGSTGISLRRPVSIPETIVILADYDAGYAAGEQAFRDAMAAFRDAIGEPLTSELQDDQEAAS